MIRSSSALYRWLASTAESKPESPAVTFQRPGTGDEVTYTFGELFERARSLGSALKFSYDNQSAPLGLLMASQEDQVLHYLAGLSIGVVPGILTPPNRKLNPDYYTQTMNEVLRRCEFGAVVTDVEGVHLDSPILTPYDFDSAGGAANSHSIARDTRLNSPFIQFSSGTTGIKRGVLVDDEAVVAQLRVYGETLGISESDRVVSWLPLYHDMGFIACLNMPLAYGVHIVMLDPIDWVSNPGIYLQAVSRYKGSLSWHPNFAYAFMAERVRDAALEGVSLESLRALVNCSEPVTHRSQELFHRRFEPYGLSNNVFKGCYAMAETTFALTHGDADDPTALDPVGPVDGTVTGDGPNVSVGRPLTGVELKIVSSEFEELPDREVGEILVRSPFNFSGYYNDPESTNNSHVEGWYRTGDLGYLADDQVFVVGRKKDVLIVAGVNVFPQDIEDLVSQVDGVHTGRVSVFAAFDGRLQTERVVVLAESDEHATNSRRGIVQDIRQRVLAAFQIGNFDVSLVPRGWLVKSTSGKMARSANHDKWTRQSTGPRAKSPNTRPDRPA